MINSKLAVPMHETMQDGLLFHTMKIKYTGTLLSIITKPIAEIKESFIVAVIS